jgi:hypothetical protein
MSEHRRRERATRVTRARMDDHAGRLVDDEHVVVLVDDGKRDRLRLERFRNGRRDLDLHPFTAPQAMGRLQHLPADAHAPLLDQGPEARP